MVGVAGAVEVHVPLVGGELGLVLGLQLGRVGRLGQQLLEEVDVAGMVHRVELPAGRVAHDDHPALAHQRATPVQVEEVAQPEAHHQDRVHHRVDVVRADVGQPHGEHVGLALHRHQMLGQHVGRGALVDRLHRAGLDRGHLIGRQPPVEHAPAGRRRHRLEPGVHGHERGPVPGAPLPLALLQHRQRAVVAEGVVVDGGLDLEDGRAVGLDHLALAPVGVVQLGSGPVHERPGVLHRMDVVVVAQRPVVGQAGGGGLPAAVHGHQVDVHVHQQVALRGPAVHGDQLVVVGAAQLHHAVGVLGVVVVERALRGEGVEHPLAQGVAQLVVGHPAVQGQSRDQVHVVHPRGGRHVEDLLDDPLADVGAPHGRQRQRDVVEGDGQLHSRPQPRRQRIGVERVQQGVADGLGGIGQAREGLGRVDDPAAARRQPLQAEALTVMEQDRRGRAVDIHHQAGPRRLAVLDSHQADLPGSPSRGARAAIRRTSPVRGGGLRGGPEAPAAGAWRERLRWWTSARSANPGAGPARPAWSRD